MDRRPTEADIRAMRAAAGDDKAFAAISDKARLFALLFKIRRSLAVYDRLETSFDSKQRVRDQAAMRSALESVLKGLEGRHGGELLYALCSADDPDPFDEMAAFTRGIRRMLAANEATLLDLNPGLQFRTARKWREIDLMLKALTEVGAPVAISDKCPNLALMGKLMAYTTGRAIEVRTLKQYLIRRGSR